MKNLVLLIFVAFSHLAFCQVSYVASYHPNAGNPGGLNAGGLDNDVWLLASQHMNTNQWTSPIQISIPFEFYGFPVSSFQASQNGVITFGNPSLVPDINFNLPSSWVPNRSICAFWDSYHNFNNLGFLSTKVYGSMPNRQFWIKWSDWPLGNSPDNVFSIVLEEGTNKVYIVEQYGNSTLDATVGVQNNATEFTQFGSNNISINSNSVLPGDNGYYEFNPVTGPDVSPQILSSATYGFCGSNDSIDINVEVINYGLQTSNVLVEGVLSGIINTTLSQTYTGTLLPNVPTNVFLGKVPVTSTGTIDVTIITTTPGDNNIQNDTLLQTITVQDLIQSNATVQDETIFGANDGAIALSISGGTSPYTVIWNTGQTGITLANLAPGFYDATITDANGCQKVVSYEVMSGLMSDVEETPTSTFTLFPNPANHSVTLEIDLPQMNAITIELLSIDGKVLQRVNKNDVQSDVVKLDVSPYSAGIYLVRMNDGAFQVTKKLVLAR